MKTKDSPLSQEIYKQKYLPAPKTKSVNIFNMIIPAHVCFLY